MGFWEFNRMPQGVTNAPSTFQCVSEEEVKADPAKVEALKTWPKPKGLKELRSFLGFAGHYRWFVKNFSNIVKPLTDLTSGYPPLHKRSKNQKKLQEYHDPRKPFNDRWTPECDLAFNTIIEKLTIALVLGFADPKLPYVLHTDPSTTSLGATLYQEQRGRLRVIAYASRGLGEVSQGTRPINWSSWLLSGL